MATTETKSGFRLPWSQDHAETDEPSADAGTVAEASDAAPTQTGADTSASQETERPDMIDATTAATNDATEAAAAKLGIRVRFVEFATIHDLNRLFDEMVREQDQALLVWANPHLNGYRKEIFDLTIRHRLPAIYDVRVYPPDLIVYAAKRDDVWREAATYVDRILKGANPGDLPIGQARTFELIINTTTAKALGLTISPSLLLRADEVIQ